MPRMEIRPVVIGTAGHIDHGKSTLVRALTGIDPDRLKEERERGMTIDLGFAPMQLSDGRTVGLVDVPGHERFIRNMVAGATGVDIVVLVVAADDGVMPQTREHLAILKLVGAQRGLIALTKIDMVDPELVEMAREDIESFVVGTFLEGAPVMPISAVTGAGLDAFKAALEALVQAVEPRPTEGVFRMPVQRVFSLRGIGTVATGIPVSGEINVGAEVEILPGGQRARVRGIQAYGQATSSARAGHSSALNLTDIDRADLARGAVVATPGYFRPVRMIGARLTALDSLDRPIANRMRVRVHTGTHDARGELVLLDKDRLDPGQEGLVQLRLDEPVVSAPGDRFVVRLLSPVLTLGGGVVLEESRHRLKRFKRFVIEELGRQEESLASPDELLLSVLSRRGGTGATPADLSVELKRPQAEIDELLASLRHRGLAASPGKGERWLAAEALAGEFSELTLALDRYFGANPHRARMDLRTLRTELKADKKRLASLLKDAAERGMLEELPGGWVRPLDHEAALPDASYVAHKALLERLRADGFQPPDRKELSAALKVSVEELERLLEYAADQGELQVIGEWPFLAAHLQEVRARIRELGDAHPERHLEVPALRDALQTSRKYLIPLLEHFDREGVTARAGAVRLVRRA
jgi:selenocysteine-specific elongation factor